VLRRGPKEVAPVAARERDVAAWVVLVGGLVANVPVPVVAKKYPMSEVFQVWYPHDP
jgi:hypothetical protein